MSKESTSGMKSRELLVVESSMEFLMEWVCETPGESDKQVAEAVIPALKDKSIEVLFFLTFRFNFPQIMEPT